MNKLASYTPDNAQLYIGTLRVRGFAKDCFVAFSESITQKVLKVRLMTSSPDCERLRVDVGKEVPVIFRSGASGYNDLELSEHMKLTHWSVDYGTDSFPIAEFVYIAEKGVQ